MQAGIENHWTWQVDANSLGLSLGFMQGRIFSLFLDADSPSSLKLQVLSFEFKYFCCWWMEQREITIHFKLLSGWICTLLSQHLALDYTMSFLPFSRKGEETWAYPGWQWSLLGNQSMLGTKHASDGVAHCRTTRSLKKVSKTWLMNKILFWMITWIKCF